MSRTLSPCVAVSLLSVTVVAISTSLPVVRAGRRDVRLRLVRRSLHHVIIGRSGHAVLVCAAVDDGYAPAEVVVWRRRRRRPLKRRRLPRVVARALALEEAPDEVEEEDKLRRGRDDYGPSDEVYERDGRAVEVVDHLQLAVDYL